MNKNNLIRAEFLNKYQAVRGGFYFAMDDDADELIVIWHFIDCEISKGWVESVARKFNLQFSHESKGVFRLWW